MRITGAVLLVALAAACSDAPAFRSRITSHYVEIAVFPERHRLVVRDRFVLMSGVDGLSSVALLVSDAMTVELVDALKHEVSWRRSPGFVEVLFASPLERGETVMLSYAAYSDDYVVGDDSGLIEEVSVLGQVAPESSYSSSVWYYPVDARNDAAVKLAITVPQPQVAVSGGTRSGYMSMGGRTTWNFEDPARRPRLLPIGFAVAPYRSETRSSRGGLEVELHVLLRSKHRRAEWLEVAVRAATFFEEIMGPLPWDRVAICQVAPIDREAGVSLPGQILFSEGIADDALFVDEMSHQWNAYLAPLPNELAEGFATYSVALYRERHEGAARYRREIASHRRMYLGMAVMRSDRALSDPGLYSSPAYRAIAFAKPAAGLHGLRMRLGDERFFAGFRRVFETVREPETAYDDVRRAFEWAAREDLSAFFDGWLHRSGVPEIAMSWQPARVAAGPGVEVTLEQTQDAAPYEIDLDVAVRTEDDGIVTRRAALRKRVETFRWPLPSGVAGVGLQPDGTGLFRPSRR